MSTRAYLWFGVYNDYTGIYKHSDGYPEGDFGILSCIEQAKEFAWPLPRFEPDEFAAAFVAETKTGPGDVSILPEPPGDVAYTYYVTANGKNLIVDVYSGSWDIVDLMEGKSAPIETFTL